MKKENVIIKNTPSFSCSCANQNDFHISQLIKPDFLKDKRKMYYLWGTDPRPPALQQQPNPSPLSATATLPQSSAPLLVSRHSGLIATLNRLQFFPVRPINTSPKCFTDRQGPAILGHHSAGSGNQTFLTSSFNTKWSN